VARFDRAIPPGGEGEILLSLNTKGYQGTMQKYAVAYTNDRKNPQVQLTVRAQVKVPISIRPRGVMLEGFVDDTVQKLVTIEGHLDRPLTLEPKELSLPKKVAYELKAVKKGRIYHVILRNISRKEDRYSGFLRLKTNYPEKPEINVLFLGYIRGNLLFQPQSIDFGTVKTSDSAHKTAGGSTYERSVLVSVHRGENLKISKIEADRKLFETKLRVVQPGKSYQIDVRLIPDKLPKGVVAEKLKVYTNLKDKPVGVIPILVRKE
jgi:hypothetical protein